MNCVIRVKFERLINGGYFYSVRSVVENVSMIGKTVEVRTVPCKFFFSLNSIFIQKNLLSFISFSFSRAWFRYISLIIRREDPCRSICITCRSVIQVGNFFFVSFYWMPSDSSVCVRFCLFRIRFAFAESIVLEAATVECRAISWEIGKWMEVAILNKCVWWRVAVAPLAKAQMLLGRQKALRSF